MLPLFKSHYSVGKSILTLDSPSENVDEGASSSIFNIVNKHNLKQVILVEDSLMGFLEAKKQADSLGVQLIFGLRIDFCENIKEDSCTSSSHKIIIFAKNTKGCQRLNKIYTLSQTLGKGAIDPSNFKKLFNKKDLEVCIPFYDSFLFHNCLSYREPCLLDHSFYNPIFFVENNGLPFDSVIEAAVRNYCGDQHPIQQVKSIYYENREDFEAYQTYKCICSRGFSSKPKTLDMPNLDHCGSPEFCFESYLEHESS